VDLPDHQNILQQLTALEQRVEQLIRAIAAQEETCDKLKQQNSGLEEELRRKVESEKRYAEEKTIIRSKIDNLLAKLEDISDAA